MFKNIVFDIGGVILDDCDEVLVKFLNKSQSQVKELSKMVYGNPDWKRCLLGEISQNEHLKRLIEKFPHHQRRF